MEGESSQKVCMEVMGRGRGWGWGGLGGGIGTPQRARGQEVQSQESRSGDKGEQGRKERSTNARQVLKLAAISAN